MATNYSTYQSSDSTGATAGILAPYTRTTNNTDASSLTVPAWVDETHAIGVQVNELNLLPDWLDLWEEQKFEMYAYCDHCGFRHNYAYDICVRCGAR